MSEDNGSMRTVPHSFDSWPDYWKAQGMPWRTEPDIDEERQAYLAARRAVKPNIEKGIYPFRDENGSIKLTRADGSGCSRRTRVGACAVRSSGTTPDTTQTRGYGSAWRSFGRSESTLRPSGKGRSLQGALCRDTTG